MKTPQTATKPAAALKALRRLHQVCQAMDLEDQMKRPTERQYLAAMAAAKRVIDAAEVPR